MPTRPYILAESTWKTVDATPYDVAVLPWGATEAHNYHLPYATDNIQCDALAAEAARRAWERGAKVVVLPCVPFGVNTGQLDIKLCLNMNPSTQAALLADLAHALEGQGIHKLVIFNGHGGNDFRQIIRELQPRTKVFLSLVNWYRIGDRSAIFSAPGDHADELETSVMMHLAPDAGAAAQRSRRRARASLEHPRAARRLGVGAAPLDQVSADTGTGNPAQAIRGEGRAIRRRGRRAAWRTFSSSWRRPIRRASTRDG